MDKYLYEETRLRMAHRAKALGIWALVLSIALASLPFIGFCLGALAIVFGFISKGYKEKFDKDVKIGFITALAGIVIAVSITGSAFYKLYTDPVARKEVFELSEYLYGDTFEEFYGESFSDVYEKIYGGIDDVDL